MAPSDNSEEDLLARLKALNTSSAPLSTSSSMKQRPENDLAARFLAFSSQNPPDARKTAHDLLPSEDNTWGIDEDGKTIEELLADLGPSDQWTLSPDYPKDIAKVMKEADSALAASQADEQQDSNEDDHLHENPDVKPDQAAEELAAEVQTEVEETLDSAEALQRQKDGNNTAQDADVDDEHSEEALQRILDELSLENVLLNQDLISKGKASTSTSTGAARPTNTDENHKGPSLSLPSVPNNLRSLPISLQSDIFDLPSVPTAKPTKKHPNTDLPVYTNQEIETWCEICNDDATIRCLGCDGDLYCAGCWKEGHTGPDAGFEEKLHKWVKYVKPKA